MGVISVDRRAELFGAAVTIADLALHSFPDHDGDAVTIYQVWDVLERDWSFEIDADASEAEYAIGVTARFVTGPSARSRPAPIAATDRGAGTVAAIDPHFCKGCAAMTYQPTAETLAIVQRLGGRWQGGYAMVRCPAHADRTPSLSIRQGQRSILVHCFAGCDGAHVMQAIAHTLGERVPVSPNLPVPANDPGAPFRRIWDEAGPIHGTLGERYLADVRGIRFRPPDVRFHARCPKGKGQALRFLPALLVGVFRRGNLIAIQRLFLDRDTGRRTARMMLGNSRGGTWPSRIAGPGMTIAEGFESACAYWQVTGHPAGTCFGARNFAGFDVPEGTSAITLLPDNDDEGGAQAEHAIAVRRSQGIDANVERCPVTSGDWADLLCPIDPAALGAGP